MRGSLVVLLRRGRGSVYAFSPMMDARYSAEMSASAPLIMASVAMPANERTKAIRSRVDSYKGEAIRADDVVMLSTST